jgi:predicted PurR-regulated permease PerM
MSQSHRSEIVFAFAVAVLVAAAYVARGPLVIIYVSALFAAMISPLVDRVHRMHIGRWHPSRGLVLLFTAVLGLGLAALVGLLELPRISNDLQQLTRELPRLLSSLLERARHYPIFNQIDPSTLQQHAAQVFGKTVQLFPAIASGVLGLFTFVILTVYFVLEGSQAFRWTISLFPTHAQPRLAATLRRAQEKMWKWLAGQALLMIILGVSSAITYALMGIRYAMVLGLFTGLANIVPVVGPVASVLLAAAIAAVDSWAKAAGVLIFYAIYQQVENAFLTPRIMKRLTGLPGLAIIVALCIGGAVAGILGALVAVPSAALVSVIVHEYLVHPTRKSSTEGKQAVSEGS